MAHAPPLDLTPRLTLWTTNEQLTASAAVNSSRQRWTTPSSTAAPPTTFTARVDANRSAARGTRHQAGQWGGAANGCVLRRRNRSTRISTSLERKQMQNKQCHGLTHLLRALASSRETFSGSHRRECITRSRGDRGGKDHPLRTEFVAQSPRGAEHPNPVSSSRLGVFA